jgi:hypothetical protein
MSSLTKKINLNKTLNRPIRVGLFSNGPELPTGYAKVVREIGTRLAKDERFSVCYLNENFMAGQKSQWNGIDVIGVHNPNMGELFKTFHQGLVDSKADVCLILEDSFTLKNFGFENIMRTPAKRIFYIPLDGAWVPTTGINVLRSMDKIVSMAKFTQKELAKEGFSSDMIWHGVDLNLFHPVDDNMKSMIRQQYGFKPDDFIIYNYGRNSLRKNNQALIRILC